MEYFVSFLAVVAFGVFIYRKVKASKEARESRPAPTPREPTPYDERSDRR